MPAHLDALLTSTKAPEPATPNALAALPPELARRRILNTDEAAAFCGMSVVSWRRGYKAGTVPAPIKISARRYGWPVGDLIDWQEAKRAPLAA